MTDHPFTRQYVQRIATVVAAILIVLALYLSNTASQTATRVATNNSALIARNTALIARVEKIAADDKLITAASQADVCARSTSLNALLDDLGGELQQIVVTAPDPHVLTFVKRIARYTAVTDPSCVSTKPTPSK